MIATQHPVSWPTEICFILISAGFTLTVLGAMAQWKVRRLGPATSGRFRYRERRAPFYLRIGPPIFIIGLVALAVVHWW